ncbi:hypothetical protein GGD81_004282 [Rhodobium orientis]|uniref:Uncharacterized protein n=1 Tax=Rhodobium orientis TaxID=34017 RepID=A0A327JLB7_9HYPH|nr:hypothetical protein [Rhodobium orientis]MBB4305213.1 hypothetical protein [Rhodobium orientis]MBK5948684.1 hypothetical protein [Rhodobium orientis]RAI26695.1 hypothetical protein CH339_13190 [Rhodobium orientis]
MNPLFKLTVGTALAAAILTAGAIAIGSTAEAASMAKACKSWVSGGGHSIAKFQARNKARLNWSANVTGTYGASWANYAIAKKGADGCNIAQGLWHCNIRAKPCKPFGYSTMHTGPKLPVFGHSRLKRMRVHHHRPQRRTFQGRAFR